jgi:hypothetical protein
MNKRPSHMTLTNFLLFLLVGLANSALSDDLQFCNQGMPFKKKLMSGYAVLHFHNELWGYGLLYIDSCKTALPGKLLIVPGHHSFLVKCGSSVKINLDLEKGKEYYIAIERVSNVTDGSYSGRVANSIYWRVDSGLTSDTTWQRLRQKGRNVYIWLLICAGICLSVIAVVSLLHLPHG